MLREVQPATDLAGICEIYNHYVEHTCVTFEEDPVLPEDMQSRIEQVTAAFPWLVYEEAGRVLGYAYANQWKPRGAFRYTVEASVYLHVDSAGRGLGSQLYRALLDRLRAQGTHLVIAGISLPNEASIRLHQRLGFQEAGYWVQAGYKFDRWIDLSYWQMVL